jgi:predicted permease
MSTAYWIVAGITAFAFFGSGMMKLISSREKLLANKNMGWAADFTSPQIKLIGLAEVLGATGLILPHALSIAEGLAKAAALGLFLIMAGAANTHRKRKEPIIPAVVLGVLAFVTVFLK